MFIVDTTTADTTKGVIDIILQHGITGALLVIVLFAYFRKDKSLDDERNARLADEKEHGDTIEKMTATLAALQEKTNTGMQKLLDLCARWEQRERDKEIREQASEDARRPGKPLR